jgi:hypothetical protein
MLSIRPVEIVESKSEYTERDIATRSMIWGSKDGDELVAVPRESMDSDWLRNMMPRPFGDSEWQRGSQHREESNDSLTRSTIQAVGSRAAIQAVYLVPSRIW